MSAPKITLTPARDLLLDPGNPRLGVGTSDTVASQVKILEDMKEWDLQELAISFAESGFWPQEALVVVLEDPYETGSDQLVAVEGNRRLATVQLLIMARDGLPGVGKRWKDLASECPPDTLTDLENNLPVILADNREAVESYLGFRHVTGIKPWHPVQKAGFIAKLIEDSEYSYTDVMRKIGSKTPTVRKQYLTHCLLRQITDETDISTSAVEENYSLLYLAVQSPGIREYIGISMDLNEKQAKNPVPSSHIDELPNVVRWLYGSKSQPRLVPESRQVDVLGRMLQDEDTRKYLESEEHPQWEAASGTCQHQ